MGSRGLWKSNSSVVPPGALESPLPSCTGVPQPPIPPQICELSYHLRPPLNPPLICNTSLSDSIETLVILTVSPTRPAGPYSRDAACQAFLSKVPVDSNGSAFLDRGSSVFTVAYSAIRPRMNSMRSCSVSLSTA